MAGSLTRLGLALAGLCAGVIYGFGRPAPFAVVCSLVAAATGLTLRRRRGASAAAIAILAFSLGAVDSAGRIRRGDEVARRARDVPRCTFTGIALETEGALGTLASASLRCASGDVEGLVFIRGARDAGARLSGEGWLVPLGADDFGDARRRFGAGAELDVRELVVRPPRAGPLAMAAALRSSLASATRGLSEDRAALLTGVTTGDASRLDDEAVADFRRAGLSHIVAVSGENVAMVLGALALVTRRLGLRARVALALGVLGLFVLVVGPQPSVLRAAAMAVAAIAGLALGVRAEPWHAFVLALIAVVALRPAILFSAGLQLSAAATAGILLWAAPLRARLSALPAPVALGLAVTVSAQFATAPLVAALFGSVSLAGPFANLVALPAVPPATVLGLCAALAGTVSPAAATVFARLAEPFVAWVLIVARVFGRLPGAAPGVPAWSAWILAAACAVAAAAAVYGRLDRTVRVAAMPDYAWMVHDEDGRDLRTTESFSSREDAEEWLGREWSALAAAGGDSVSLVSEGEVVYRMSLQPE